MAYVIQEIFEPIVFYANTSFKFAKRYKRKANAEKIINDYPEYKYLMIEEEMVGTEEHKQLFIPKRIICEKQNDLAHRQRYDFDLPEHPESFFKDLAEKAWYQFTGEFNG